MIAYIMVAVLLGAISGLLVAVLIKLIDGINLINELHKDTVYMVIMQPSDQSGSGKNTTSIS